MMTEDSNEKIGKSLNVQLTPEAHANLNLLKRELVEGTSHTVPEFLNGLLESLTLESARVAMQPYIQKRFAAQIRAKKLEKFLVNLSEAEVESLLAKYVQP